MFKCSHCALVFDSATLLNIHTLMHAADRCDTMQVEEEGAENNIDALAQLSAAAAQINTGKGGNTPTHLIQIYISDITAGLPLAVMFVLQYSSSRYSSTGSHCSYKSDKLYTIFS